MNILQRTSSYYGLQYSVWGVQCFLLLTILVLGNATAQLTDPSEDDAAAATGSPKRLEDTVVRDMLNIVDHKFDTLTTRLTSLERAVSNLQFFSIRQFRQMGGSLQAVSGNVETISKQVSQLEVDGRGMKITSSLLHREVSELKSRTSELLDELDSSVVYINKNMDKQTQFLKSVIQESLLKTSQDSVSKIQKSLHSQLTRRMSRLESQQRQSVNCSVDFKSVYEHVDLRFAHFKKDVHSNFVDLINAEKSEAAANCDELRQLIRNGNREKIKETVEGGDQQISGEGLKELNKSTQAFTTERRPKLDKKNLKQSTTVEVPPRGLAGILTPLKPVKHSQKNKNFGKRKGVSVATSSAETPTAADIAWQNEQDALVMELLLNMTTSVQQAVSFFRGSSRMLELIVSNTDMLLSAQADTGDRANPVPVPTGSRGIYERRPVSDGPGSFVTSDTFPNSRESGQPGGGFPVYPEGGRDCSLPAELAASIATIAKNGSQLLEILTDLAQMSSLSLHKTAASLENEVTRVEGIRTRMATTMLAVSATARETSGRNIAAKLTNTTEETLKLVQTIASNSGWLPAIYNNDQRQGHATNRTLQFVSRNHGMLRQLVQLERQQQQQQQRKARAARKESERLAKNKIGGRRGDEFQIDERSMHTIYNTSLQLHRIMPALTKLLAEPDPLFTIVDGGRPDQGRVEVYHKGQWGAICQEDLSHFEANTICRHLGFAGGISAGAGHFGAGAGLVWSFNASCLASLDCPVVSYAKNSAPCSHERDVGVICDHMLRIVSHNGTSTDKSGRLEMHHRGVWLPVCGHAWSGYSARVACQQMGFLDGRELVDLTEWQPAGNTTWLARVECEGSESRLDACRSEGWASSCPDSVPAGVRCL